MADDPNPALTEAQKAFDAARVDDGKKIDDLTAQVAAHGQTIDELRQQLSAADKRGDDEEKRADAAEGQVSGLTAQLASANQRADNAEAAQAATAATVTQADAAKKPRKLGKIDGYAVPFTRTDDKTSADRDDLKRAIADADDVEIAFSDGKAEIAGSKPAVVSGDCWQDHPFGLMLDKPVTIAAPADGGGFTLVGYALVLDGKQAAWAERNEPLNLWPGRKLNIEQDIFF